MPPNTNFSFKKKERKKERKKEGKCGDPCSLINDFLEPDISLNILPDNLHSAT